MQTPRTHEYSGRSVMKKDIELSKRPGINKHRFHDIHLKEENEAWGKIAKNAYLNLNSHPRSTSYTNQASASPRSHVYRLRSPNGNDGVFVCEAEYHPSYLRITWLGWRGGY